MYGVIIGPPTDMSSTYTVIFRNRTMSPSPTASAHTEPPALLQPLQHTQNLCIFLSVSPDTTWYAITRHNTVIAPRPIIILELGTTLYTYFQISSTTQHIGRLVASTRQ
jgi:hypothetical protein